VAQQCRLCASAMRIRLIVPARRLARSDSAWPAGA
jgi:hypothetical protein